MTSQCVLRSLLFTPTPPHPHLNLPASVPGPALSHRHVFPCDRVIYQTLVTLSHPLPSFSLLSWVVKTWPPELGGIQRGPAVGCSAFSCVRRLGHPSFRLRTINTIAQEQPWKSLRRSKLLCAGAPRHKCTTHLFHFSVSDAHARARNLDLSDK